MSDRCVLVDGRLSLEKRQHAVDRFQNDPNCQVFIGSIQAAGVGLTLTSASIVVFAELDWTPAALSQAEDRCHRIGQSESVLVQHIVLDGSLDARMAEVVTAKQEVLDRALDGGGALEEAEQFAAPIEQPATQASTPSAIAKEAAAIAPGVVQAVHAALRTLAGYCDGANARDGMGFSKFDAGIGHSLAGASRLTAKQAALGRKIALKYRRQLSAELLAGMAP